MKNHCINLTSLGFAVVALVLHIVCTATPYYITIDISLDLPDLLEIQTYNLYVEFGMFMFCICELLEPEDKKCQYNGDQSGVGLNTASQTMSILGVLLLAMGTLLLLLHIFRTCLGNRQRLLPHFILALCGTGAFLILLGDGLIVKYFYDSNFDGSMTEFEKMVLDATKFNWGFYLDIVAGVLALLASVSQAVAIRVSRSQESGIIEECIWREVPQE